MSQVQSRTDEVVLQNRTAEEQLRRLMKEKDELMVQHDVLRLDVRRLRDTLAQRSDEVYAMENRRVQLAMTTEERRK